jgi:H+/gluconate symporter-like permease
LHIDEKTTLKSWTVMETLIGISALIVSMIISIVA